MILHIYRKCYSARSGSIEHSVMELKRIEEREVYLSMTVSIPGKEKERGESPTEETHAEEKIKAFKIFIRL